ncbi:DUF397 domain-containing protein [Streptomyces radicis]|uniref:DUF397 domain-containing protein n=1 Tax=Streptomyces radicis TaxID=1750517 RepID=A0A3A9WE64_9ACTN|nr:DUF397 domain-containing protein [Streptomyces radicis]RKN11060.1 DUF397 domain-containing protein [Streptomyces radicis]RKN25323.1 DUF397 domain-containing protein [Streptomyces radicis]
MDVSLVWRKSSHSGADNGDCVEVADGVPGLVPVRDSKAPGGPVLTFTADQWRPFAAALGRSRRLAS